MYEKENLYRNNQSSIEHRCWRSLAALGYRTFCAGREAAMKVLDLFSGIGGFSLGLERAGMKTVAFCEIDPFCRKVLGKHWPDVPIYEDIRDLKGDEIEADIICGGFPCQPFSSINTRGKRGAEHDGFLWPEMLRVISEAKPTWVIGENVARLKTMELDRIQADLEAIGFASISFTIPACAVGSPQIRDRVWIVAHTEGKREPRAVDASEGKKGKDAPSGGQQDGGSIWLDAASTDRGWSGRRASYPGVRRVAPGLPGRMDKNRIKALGNAVNPLIPYELGRAIGFAQKVL